MTVAETRGRTSLHTEKARYFVWKILFLLTYPSKSFETLFRLFSRLNSLIIVQKKNKALDTFRRRLMSLKPGFHIVVSVVSVVSVLRKKFIGWIEFTLSCRTSCICRFFCIEHLYGRFPKSCICPMNFFRTTDTTDTAIWKPGFTV